MSMIRYTSDDQGHRAFRAAYDRLRDRNRPHPITARWTSGPFARSER